MATLVCGRDRQDQQPSKRRCEMTLTFGMTEMVVLMVAMEMEMVMAPKE